MNLKNLAELLPTSKGSWQEYFFANALAQTIRADCTRRQFGCVAVNPQNRIVAAGYNSPPPGELSAVQKHLLKFNNVDGFGCCKDKCDPANSTYDKCNALHAEHNCLNELGTRNEFEYVDLYLAGRNGSTGKLINSAPPCIFCARTIKAYNVRNINCLQEDSSIVVLNPSDLKTTL